MGNFIAKIKQKMEERKAVTTFCTNRNCCYIPCRYNSKRVKNPKKFAFFENTNKCKRSKLF